MAGDKNKSKKGKRFEEKSKKENDIKELKDVKKEKKTDNVKEDTKPKKKTEEVKKEDKKANEPVKKEKRMTKKEQRQIEDLGKAIEAKKQLPEDEVLKINKRVFNNILIAIIIMLYMYLLNLGSINIKQDVFMMDLKVFSIGLILLTIVIFETSYKKENGSLCIYGIEILALSILTLCLTYAFTIRLNIFNLIVTIASFSFAVYYVTKAAVILVSMKRKYLKRVISDVSEITKKV